MIARNQNENEEQFIWRICQAKDSGLIDCDWGEIADIINKEFRSDESEYRSEAAYRKPYQQAKRFYEAGVFDSYGDTGYLNELEEKKRELIKERIKLRDERTAINRNLRTKARNEQDINYLNEAIQKRGFTYLPQIDSREIDSENDLVIALSDLHLGLNCSSRFGAYSTRIAKTRLSHYLDAIREIQKNHNAKNAYVILLGDICNGNIHFTNQLENRENVIEQIQTAGEMISTFMWELSGIFEHIYINSVAGNHSRIGLKDNVLRDERLDDLVPWYMKAELRHIENITFLESANYDATISYIDVRDNKCLIVHGDYDSFDERGVSKLVMMVGYKPTAIFMGHGHKNSFDDVAGIKIIRSGSLAGSGDDYCITKRLSGEPGQMVTVMNENGVVSCYPIEL
jgi:metallophosphoesterase superfamily enzyme